MQYHILSGCGSFMAGLATIISDMGHDVVAYDEQFQPPMKNQLLQANVSMVNGYADDSRIDANDKVIIGNAIKRGNPLLEKWMLEKRQMFSGPEYLKQAVLNHKRTIAIAGTHGKTTTSAMMAWALEALSEQPGFLLGGIPVNFQTSARLGKGDWFCIEADEYDTVLWDKRPKFFYYPADVLVINNLEFDHADIYRDLEDIAKQFRHYLKTLRPGTKVVFPNSNVLLRDIVEQATWLEPLATYDTTPAQSYHVRPVADDWSSFVLHDVNNKPHVVNWDLFGEHNAMNALSVFRALTGVGFAADAVAQALEGFQGVRRRMQKIGVSSQEHTVWDDFAHHPTALGKIIEAARLRFASGRLVICLQLTNYTQREGIMWQDIQQATAGADLIIILSVGDKFPYQLFKAGHKRPVVILEDGWDDKTLRGHLEPGDHVITCSSRDCSHIHQAVLS